MTPVTFFVRTFHPLAGWFRLRKCRLNVGTVRDVWTGKNKSWVFHYALKNRCAMPLLHAVADTVACYNRGVILEGVENEALFRIARDMNVGAVRDGSTGVWKLMNYPRLLSCMDNPFSQTCQQPAFMFFYLREFICPLCRDISVIQKSGRNKL